jgi:hypothetical protein
MRALFDTLEHHRRQRPVAMGLITLGVALVLGGSLLPAAGHDLLAQLVVGLALVPLSVAIALFLLPAPLWLDDSEERGGPGHGGDDGRGGPSDRPDGGVDWARFEHEFAQYVEQHRAVAA